MDFLSVVQAARRRWKLVFVLVVATGVAAVVVGAAVPVSYEAHGAVLLEGPVVEQVDANGRPVAQNRFLNGGGTLNVVGDIIARVLNEDSMQEALKAERAGSYEITNQAVGAPLLTIVATSDSGDQAVRTVDLVTKAISDELAIQQYSSGVDSDAAISARPLVAPDDPDVLYGGRTRAVAVVVILGLAVSLSMAVLLDGVAQRRRTRASGTGQVVEVGAGAAHWTGTEAFTPLAGGGTRAHRRHTDR